MGLIGVSENSNFTTDLCLGGDCSPGDVVVLHGNCDNDQGFQWKKLIYDMVDQFHSSKLKIAAKSSGVSITQDNGAVIPEWYLTSKFHPRCNNRSEGTPQDAAAAWNAGVCRLFSEIFSAIVP
jgi:hypothetical protein